MTNSRWMLKSRKTWIMISSLTTSMMMMFANKTAAAKQFQKYNPIAFLWGSMFHISFVSGQNKAKFFAEQIRLFRIWFHCLLGHNNYAVYELSHKLSNVDRKEKRNKNNHNSQSGVNRHHLICSYTNGNI